MAALVFEVTKLIAWTAVTVLLVANKKAIPLNIFWLMAISAALMLYAVVASFVSHHILGTHVRDLGNLVVACSYMYLIYRYRYEYRWVREYRKRHKMSI